MSDSASHNTVVVSSDHNYIWGVYLMVCSMRKNGMNEPVLVLGFSYTETDIAALNSLGNVRVVDGKSFSRSLTCAKPDAMCLAETDYITWVDCDSFFIGNCSDLLTVPDPDVIHVRRRSEIENHSVVKHLTQGNVLPESLLSVWRKDVGERTEPRFNTCCSACFLSLNRKYLPFLRRWSTQMAKVIPEGDKGVTDSGSFGYFQTDESVLNSLLIFADNAPRVSDEYQLDKIDSGRYYVHFISRPKPWMAWTPHAFRFFREYTALADWAQDTGKVLPSEIPRTLQSKRYFRNWLISRFTVVFRKMRTLRKKIAGK